MTIQHPDEYRRTNGWYAYLNLGYTFQRFIIYVIEIKFIESQFQYLNDIDVFTLCKLTISHRSCSCKGSRELKKAAHIVCGALYHYSDVIMGAMASQITSLTIVYSTVYSGTDWREHQSSASLAFVRGIHLGSMDSPHKWPVTRKMFPFDDVNFTDGFEMMHKAWHSIKEVPYCFF